MDVLQTAKITSQPSLVPPSTVTASQELLLSSDSVPSSSAPEQSQVRYTVRENGANGSNAQLASFALPSGVTLAFIQLLEYDECLLILDHGHQLSVHVEILRGLDDNALDPDKGEGLKIGRDTMGASLLFCYDESARILAIFDSNAKQLRVYTVDESFTSLQQKGGPLDVPDNTANSVNQILFFSNSTEIAFLQEGGNGDILSLRTKSFRPYGAKAPKAVEQAKRKHVPVVKKPKLATQEKTSVVEPKQEAPEDLNIQQLVIEDEEPDEPVKTEDCPICLCDHPITEVNYLEQCGHAFGNICLREYICDGIKNHRYPIACPVCTIGTSAENRSFVTNTLVERIGIPDELTDTYVELQVDHFTISVYCRRCSQIQFIDKNRYKTLKLVSCINRQCNYRWCKTCDREAPDSGVTHSCDGMNEFMDLMRQSHWRFCPGCNAAIEKTGGCNHITCQAPGCNMHFCYRCGAVLGRTALHREIVNYYAHFSTAACILFD